MQALLQDLDCDDFNVREVAERKLQDFGETAEPTLRAALKTNPSLERKRRIESVLSSLDRSAPLAGAALREVRAIQVLERIGSEEARTVLKRLANGLASARLTREAKASLERMARIASNKD
jgi:truncated hemoglobin YjbI